MIGHTHRIRGNSRIPFEREEGGDSRRDVLGKDEKKGKRGEGKGKERKGQGRPDCGQEPRRACSRSSRFVDLEWNARHNLP